LASGRLKPSAMNWRLAVSNSRTTTASAPPRESWIRQRVLSPPRQLTLFQTQFSFSALARASRSSSSSQAGSARRRRRGGGARIRHRQPPVHR
jgi:hypothetical protein